ncbi:MAG: ABC transporter ATP-binding protein [Candidatus Omnitrophica bacterium]|nr:ABC transporter ATP-binding protein [Candidatus Omnitrophota bacterium]
MDDIVCLKNVWVEIDGKTILQDHTLNIRQNDFLGIIGPNGGGKTTFLKVILGLIKPSHGNITVFGNSPQKSRPFIGYVPQLSNFDHEFPINVWEVVLMGRLSKRPIFQRYQHEDESLAEEALKKVEIWNLRDRQIGRLSGGERQRVFIARALISHPKLLLLDEPTASVDSKMKTKIYELLSELKKELTIILVTHDVGVISSHVDKIACLNCRIFYHDSKEITPETLEAVYHCPVDLLAHGIPHRILKTHEDGDNCSC